ncbi:unannotated protein [freshwater metagenome]|uniref:Unannotated protein n=1 Tax=freshwater metagenome TaxID=449393 RepID=A0A6J6CCX8_9ZZZZ|nr:hypothetical protein [Actinomycetota bacterium]MTA64234.1 hypothetical protein [Actinomycetota bacterium]
MGERWWLAADGKYYAPDLHPDFVGPPFKPSQARPIPRAGSIIIDDFVEGAWLTYSE